MSQTRRLAAILAADVAGYSRLIGADERSTLQRLKAVRNELIDPTIATHHGRLVKTTGDGLLVEFGSIVDGLQCATEIQASMAELNGTVPQNDRIEFRMGLNVGDIVVEDGDIFGDGVNVAARLEGLAEPGGICVSARVQEDAAGKLDLAFEDMGEKQLKNIARSVRVYRVRPEAIADLPASSVSPAKSISQPTTVAPRLSIVVLPFTNLSDDPEQQYFADGITEDLTTDLSRIVDMFVISRNTAVTYKDKRVDTKQVGRGLGVRYVLEGSVRRSGNQIRVNAQLIDAETDAHLWAERFDRHSGDLFGLQDEITGRIAITVQSELVSAEAHRSPSDPDAQDFLLRGRAAQSKPVSRGKWAEAASLFERALALDPLSAEARTRLAGALVNRVLDLQSDAPTADFQRAERLIEQVLATSPNSADVHYAKAQFLRAQSRCEDAIFEYETVIALDRNFANAYTYLGACKLLTGSVDEVIRLEEQAIRLDPRNQATGGRYFYIGAVHLLRSRLDEAILWLEKARGVYGWFHPIHAGLAAAYALKGETEQASAALGDARKRSDRYSSITLLKAAPGRQWLEAPKLRGLAEATYFEGLRKAGLSEE